MAKREVPLVWLVGWWNIILLMAWDFICKPSTHRKNCISLNYHLIQERWIQLRRVKYASPEAHSSWEKQRNRTVDMCLIWSIVNSADRIQHYLVKWVLRPGPLLQCWSHMSPGSEAIWKRKGVTNRVSRNKTISTMHQTTNVYCNTIVVTI